jgi:GT2 family glycosyltransferase
MRLSKQTKSTLTCVSAPARGFSAARNTGLSIASNKWVSFVDDDCVVDPHWILTMKKSVTKHPEIVAVVGRSETFFPTNIFALATRYHELQWKMPAIQDQRVVDLEVLDTKNIILNKTFLYKRSLHFDETRIFNRLWTNDDIDFGMRVWKAGGSSIYNPSMIVYHKDATTLSGYWKKTWLDTISYLIYKNTWQNERVHIEPLKKPVSRREIMSKLQQTYHFPERVSHKLNFLLFITAWLIRIARLYARLRYSL